MRKNVELYLHIPFCVIKCDYCDFLSISAGEEVQRQYLDAMVREIRNTILENAVIDTIFIGGGTPTVVPAVWIAQIMDILRERFTVAENAEISMEANPGTVSEEALKIYRESGINRLSFGCQSADDRELKLLGRIHSFHEFLESYHMAREAGFQNINVDLMSGIPEQTVSSWEKTLDQILKLRPEHISAYSLIVEEGTPFWKRKLNLPEEEEERYMYEYTAERLKQAGMEQYEISNYALPGYICRHNVGYWKRIPYYGFGIGAASLKDEMRFSNTTVWNEYLENSGEPEKIRKNIEKLSIEDQMAETMFLGLRMMEGVSERAFADRFGRSITEVYGTVIEKYEKTGFLKQEQGRVFLTRQGISVSNHIMADFL